MDEVEWKISYSPCPRGCNVLLWVHRTTWDAEYADMSDFRDSMQKLPQRVLVKSAGYVDEYRCPNCGYEENGVPVAYL